MTGYPATRVPVITELLERYHDLADPLNGPGGVKGDGLGYAAMPQTYNSSVREVERLVKTMRDDRPRSALLTLDGEKVSVRQCWWHINEWFLKAERTLHEPRKPATRSKRRQLIRLQVDEHGRVLPQVRVRRNAAAREQVAKRGVEWMAEHWGLRHEPMLPTQVLEDLAA